ncbi:MAG TPA: carboxypeptidase-like regulatory domain-containing protein, partial [Candidatus Deferrimicrobiaceae bacterium]
MKAVLRLFPFLLLALCPMLLPGCGESSSGASGASVSGVVYAPNGIDPIAGAQVAAIPASGTGGPVVFAMIGNGPSGATTVSGPDGRFLLEGLAPGEYTLQIVQGMFRQSCPLPVTGEDEIRLPVSQTTLPAGNGGAGAGSAASAPRIAVVTGAFDEMANVLAKFGMGQVDDNGALLLGTETFDLYVSATNRPVWNDALQDFSWDEYPGNYPSDSVLFANLASMRQYDVIVINCGSDQQSLYEPGEPGVIWNLREFVRLGGRLYVTDLSNNFVEHAFPASVRFQAGGTDSPSVPEPLCAAWVGRDGITSDAAVRDATLA